MKLKSRNIIAKMLLIVLLATNVFSNVSIAAEVNSENVKNEIEAEKPDSPIEDNSNDSLYTEDSAKSSDAQEGKISDAVGASSSEQENEDNMGENSASTLGTSKINYVGVEQPYLQAPCEQNIVVSFGDGSDLVQDAKIFCEGENGENIEFSLSSKTNELFIFTRTFTESEAGIYRLSSFTYVSNEQETNISMPDIGIDAMFGVNEEYPGYAEEEIDNSINLEDIEISVVDVDTNKVKAAESNIEDAIEITAAEVTEKENIDQEEGVAKSASRAAGKARDVVVVLDPGHGGSDGGAAANGLVEKNLNLRIAQYCKEELETYSGVKVYMTRYDDSYVGLSERVQKAKGWGADVLVSLHNNSATPAATGTEVWYPNSSYNSSIHDQGASLSSDILNELTALGLANRGIKIRNSENNSKYPDGSIADYYSIINESKRNGFPGIIVEHAFITNASDAQKLSQDSFLKQLGIADARGIANYFGLTQNPTVEIINKNDFTDSCQVKYSGCGKGAAIAIWSEVNGQDDLRWYYLGEGSGTLDLNYADFNNSVGKYFVHVYNYDTSKKLCTTSFRVSTDTKSLISAKSVEDKEIQYKIELKFNDMPDEVKAVSFPVWSKADQSDIIWHSAKQTSTGVWSANINIRDYGMAGTYQAHSYAVLASGKLQFLGKTQMAISEPSLNVNIANYNSKNGTFDVIVDQIISPSGVASIQVPVWCAPDQSDIVWYNAEKQSDNTYKVHVSAVNHKYATGIYQIHTYLLAGNGIFKNLKRITQEVKLPESKVSVSDTNGKETTYDMKVTNAGIYGVVRNVQFATWSESGGQDDIIWYQGTQKTPGQWEATADIRNHRTTGKYDVHVYVTLSDGTLRRIGITNFYVSPISVTSVEVQNYDKKNGTFDVVVTGISSKSKITQVNVPIWCASDQSDIKWYDAEKQSDGTYKAHVSIANHKYASGTYQIHTYVTTNNGIFMNINKKTQNVELPEIGISASDTNGKEATYVLKVTNAGVFGVVRNVQFATWSEIGGQDDLIWYQGTQKAPGTWETTADIRKHATAGKYNVHIYATLANGTLLRIGITNFDVSHVGVSDVEVQNYIKESGTFDVVVKGVTSKSGIAHVNVPIWCSSDQSDIKWYEAEKQSDGTYKAHVSIANHKYASGTYQIHTYVTAENGVFMNVNKKIQSVELPEIGLSATDTSGKEKSYLLKATNMGIFGAVRNVQFATWSETGGQDDIVWYEGTKKSTGTWEATADIRNHGTAGKYIVHLYVTLADGFMKKVGTTSYNVSDIDSQSVALKVSGYDASIGSFMVTVSGMKAVSGIKSVQIPVWSKMDQSDIKWYAATKQADGSYMAYIDPMYHQYNSGTYKIHAYAIAENNVMAYVGKTEQNVAAVRYYSIMGDTSVNVSQMVKYYQSSGHTYPSAQLGIGGAGSIGVFCQLYIEEANKEGVRAEVAFAQAMKETGWLKYGGIVRIEQFNFAGIGALDGNSTGMCASFPDVRTGIRAQIQHLKAYGTSAPLNNPCVDPRFHLVRRGVSPYVEWLGIPDNPYGAGWATAPGYGYSIVNMIKKMKTV